MNNLPASSARTHLIMGFTSLFILVGGFGGWAALTSISGAVIAPGQIKAILDEQVVQHPSGGVVEKIYVRNGDIVQQGDPMIRLDGTLASAELNAALYQEAEITVRAARLEAERQGLKHVLFSSDLMGNSDVSVTQMIEGQREIFQARQDARQKEVQSHAQRKLQIDAQIKGLIAEREATQLQMNIIDGEIVDQEHLFGKGLAQASRLNTLRRQRAGLMGTIGSLDAQVGQAGEKRSELEAEFVRQNLNLKEQNATELRDIRAQLLGLQEKKITLNDRLSRLDIRAPIDGMVHGLMVHALQGVISPGDQLVQVVPVGQQVVVSTRVQPLNIDEVYLDQEASLRFSALNQRITPVLEGRVTNISADALSDPKTGASYYQVEITPNNGELDKLGIIAPLPGMPVEGYISTSSRSPLSYLTKPLLDYFSRALRES